jgi:hypothetical protein
MGRQSNATRDRDAWRTDTFPDDLSNGGSVLVATSGDPTRYTVALHALCEYGDGADTAFVVTTTRSADTTLETYDRLCPDGDRPHLRLVDTTARQPSVSSMYREAATSFIPAPGDLERLVIALSDLSESTPPSDGARHLVIRSLTPILEETPVERVQTVLDRVTGLRANAGLCLLGIDYTAHDETVIRRLAEQVDGILWVTEAGDDALEFDYRPTDARGHRRPIETPE